MASLKVKFKPSTHEGEEGVLYYQIVHKRMVRMVSTAYHLASGEWDDQNGHVVTTDVIPSREKYLTGVRQRIQADIRRFHAMLRKLAGEDYTVNELAYLFKKMSAASSLFAFFESVASAYREQGQERTRETYISTLNSLKRFRNQQDLDLTDVDVFFLFSYESWLRSEGLSHNTISFYLRRFRSVYNKAVEQGLIEQRYPFRKMKLNVEKTVKRAISVRYIRQLREMAYPEGSPRDFARDMFLFSFYTRGMSFVDMAYLRKTDLKEKVLAYRRKKTGQRLVIHWETCMEEIVDKYAQGRTSPFLLPVIEPDGGDARKQCHKVLTYINRHLKAVGKDLGLDIPLTMYVARHTWATTAHYEGIPLSVISEGLGHDSEKTTQIYLASMENEIIDKANRKVLNEVL